MNKYLIIFIFFFTTTVYSSEIEIRKPGDCGGHRVPAANPEKGPAAGTSRPGLGNEQLTGEQKEELKNFPKKISIERSRLIARLQYLKEWDQNPMAIRNLLLFIEKNINVPAISIKNNKTVKLNNEQKLSIFDQLQDFEINLDEVHGEKIARPVLSGDVPGPFGGEEAIATFDVIGEAEMKEADSFVILFMTGLSDFNLDDRHIEKLRNYLLRGGFLFSDAASGNQEFAKGFRKLVGKMFPEKKLELMPATHPVFSTVFDLKKIRYTGKNKSPANSPRMEGLQLGCRTAIIFSPDTVSCGWDGHMHGESIDNEIHYEDASRFGVNLAAYALGYREIGTVLPKLKTFKDLPEYNGSEIAFAQLIFKGDFDPDPFGIRNFIDFLQSKVNANIRPERILVDAERNNLFLYPLIYITGHGKIELSENAISNLGQFIKSGGMLVAEACCGDQAFDRSFRELMNKCISDNAFKIIPFDSNIYKTFYDMKSADWRSPGFTYFKKLLQQKGLDDSPFKENGIPFLEALYIKDKAAVIYSPFDLACSWEKHPCLVCRGVGVENNTGFKIGANIFVYCWNREDN